MRQDPRVMHHVLVEIRDRASLLDWLSQLPPLERARLARELASTGTTRAIRQVGDGAVYELTRQASWAEVAEQLGVGKASIGKAIERHQGRSRPRKGPEPDGG